MEYFVTGDLLLITFGMILVWPSSVIPKLQSSDPEINPLSIPITTLQTSIMVSSGQLAAPLGLILMANLADKIGRKKTMMFVATGFASALIIIACANHIFVYYFCLLIIGICLGCALGIVPVYNSEIAEDNNREKLGYIMGLTIPLGTLLGYLFGSVTTVKSFFLICAIPPILYLLLLAVVSDSPVSLTAKRSKLAALNALEKLRNTNNAKILEMEYEKIQDTLTTSHKDKKRFFDLFRKGAPRKAVLVSVEICTTQQFSGIFIILAFMAPIFNEAGSTLSGNAIGTLVGSVQILVYLLAAYFVDKYGRRTLMLVSSFTCIFPLFILGLYFYLKHIQCEIVHQINWLPIVCVVLYVVCYGIGLGPVPITLISELFPSDLRAVGVATVLIYDQLTICISLFLFPIVTNVFGAHFCMWVFSVACFIGFVGMFFTVPETKGKSFSEIQDILSK